MTCHSLAEAVIDAARGCDIGRGTAAAVETHLERCESCRARFARERRLSEGLRALAASVDRRDASPSVESRVLQAFAERETVPPSRIGVPVRRWLQAAAAAVIVAASMVGWWRLERLPPAVNPHPLASPSQATEPAAPVVAPLAANHSRPTVPASSLSQRPTSGRSRPHLSRLVRAEGFQPLPTATGLPPFESGEIVRVDVPVMSLPVYGIEIPPDARSSIVKADFLIGQDRVARAIRLVRVDRSGAGARVE